MKNTIKKMIFIFITISLFSMIVNAEESILSKIESGETVDVNLVNPIHLEKTLNHFKQKYFDMRNKDEEVGLTEDNIAWANEFYTPVGMVGEILTPYISSQIKDRNVYVYVDNCDNEYNCKVSISYIQDVGYLGDEEHIYDVKFNLIGTYDSKVEDEMLEIYDKMEENLYRPQEEIEGIVDAYKFILEDINMIDYI